MKNQTGYPSIEILTDRSPCELVKELTNQPESEEPFFLVDLGDILYKYKMWKLKMPRIHPFYAVKCNDNPVVLEILSALGVGFDCASKGEIEAVLGIGVDPSRIIYANPCKTSSFIRHAASVDVNLMTFDNEMELHKVKALHPSAKMVIRIRVDDTGAVCPLGMKFGCEVSDASHLLDVAKELGIDVVGLSFHVGSGCRDATAYARALSSARYVFDVAEQKGFHFDLLDIGGGFPGSKGDTLFDTIANVVSDSLEEYFPDECGVRVIAEPGRFFVASAFTLFTNIIAKRNVMLRTDNDEEMVRMYYLNDGVYGSFNCLIFDHAEVSPVPVMEDASSQPVYRSCLWGPTCDSMDRIMETCYLPNLDVGEWVMFENMGAYTVSAASTFNGFQRPNLKFIMLLPAWLVLKQLPSWSHLVSSLGLQQAELLLGALDVGVSVLGSNEGMPVLPLPEPISA